jgi:CRP-like cAMP-binding protein
MLNQYSPVDKPSVAVVLDNGEIETVAKNEVVFHEKRFNGFEYFQLDGVSHRYNVDSEKRIVTSGIYQGSTVITPHFTRTPNGQSLISLQALTDCTYLKVPAGVFRQIMEDHKQVGMFGRAVVEKEFIRNLNFDVLFRSSAAKDRLLYFRANYPQLENIIPHTVIASFLGITPVSLSRLRNELAQQ